MYVHDLDRAVDFYVCKLGFEKRAAPERGARLLLENAVDAEDYERAAEVAREELGVDPDLLGVRPPDSR